MCGPVCVAGSLRHEARITAKDQQSAAAFSLQPVPRLYVIWNACSWRSTSALSWPSTSSSNDIRRGSVGPRRRVSPTTWPTICLRTKTYSRGGCTANLVREVVVLTHLTARHGRLCIGPGSPSAITLSRRSALAVVCLSVFRAARLLPPMRIPVPPSAYPPRAPNNQPSHHRSRCTQPRAPLVPPRLYRCSVASASDIVIHLRGGCDNLSAPVACHPEPSARRLTSAAMSFNECAIAPAWVIAYTPRRRRFYHG